MSAADAAPAPESTDARAAAPQNARRPTITGAVGTIVGRPSAADAHTGTTAPDPPAVDGATATTTIESVVNMNLLFGAEREGLRK